MLGLRRSHSNVSGAEADDSSDDLAGLLSDQVDSDGDSYAFGAFTDNTSVCTSVTLDRLKVERYWQGGNKVARRNTHAFNSEWGNEVAGPRRKNPHSLVDTPTHTSSWKHGRLQPMSYHGFSASAVTGSSTTSSTRDRMRSIIIMFTSSASRCRSDVRVGDDLGA